MGVAGYLYALQVSQGHRALVFSEDVAQRLKVQHAEYLDVQEVRHVNGLSRALDPFPDRLGGWPGIQEDPNHGGGVQDDQRLLAEVARVVGVSHPADRDLRRLVQLNRFPATQTLHHLAQGRILGYLLDLGEQIVRERHPETRGLCL